MKGFAYHWPDLESAELDGAYDPASGWLAPLVAVPRHGWIKEPVLGDPDPQTGEARVVSPGIRPDAVMVLSPIQVPSLEHRAIETLHSAAGLSGLSFSEELTT